jgi:hypothetical protein
LKLVPPTPALKLPPDFSSVPVNPLNVEEAGMSLCSADVLAQQEHMESTVKEFANVLLTN